MPLLRQKVAIITGASSGIGAALALEFSRAGARVVLFARRQEQLERVAAACPGETLTQAGDVTSEADRRALVAAAQERWGRVDLLVNNAGLGSYGDFLDTSQEDWRRLMEINLFAAVFLASAALPAMLAQGSGLILNIASIGGLMAHADKVTPYVTSKHALVGFTRGLAKDLEGSGVTVKAACPHLTATEFFDHSQGAAELAPVAAKYRPHMDTPDEVARGILAGLDGPATVFFPTGAPARAYEKGREL